MKWRITRVAAITTVIAALAACRDRPSPPDPLMATSSTSGGGGAGGEPAAGGCEIPPEVADRWPGWHRWPHPPCDCHIFVPDDLASIEPPAWEPCPFLPEGCSRMSIFWDDTQQNGYGKGLFEVATTDGHEYLSTHYPALDSWTESVLLRDHEVIGLWRSRPSDPLSGCAARGPYVRHDGLGALSAIRAEHEYEPYVFLAPLHDMIGEPKRTETFGPPDPQPLATGRVTRSDRLLVMWEHYNQFFTVRDLETGATHRPDPPVPGSLQDPFPVGDQVVFWIWTGGKNSVWIWSAAEGHRPLLADPAYSYHSFVTDGHDALWIRGQNPVGPNSYEVVELWTAPLTLAAGALAPKLLATLPGPGAPYTSVGDGWGAVKITPLDVRLYRLSDGAERRLPTVEGWGWEARDYQGIPLANGAAWVWSVPAPGYHIIQFITRFELDKLPSP